MTNTFTSPNHRLVFVLLFLVVSLCPRVASGQDELRPPVVIAHAGGAINQMTYTNSLEALNANYEKGFRFFEIDLSWTSDGELVAIHDWEGALKANFLESAIPAPPSKNEFLKLHMKSGLTKLSLEDVFQWTKTKQGAYIVTDVKSDNINALAVINSKFSESKKFVIPQVYDYLEYREARALGYPRVILTVYRMRIDSVELLDFALQHSPFAVTMPWQAAQSGLAYDLNKNGVRVYAHTVNEFNLFLNLKSLGVFGVYTDYMAPPSSLLLPPAPRICLEGQTPAPENKREERPRNGRSHVNTGRDDWIRTSVPLLPKP